jgi:hypothetical protein
MVSNSKEYSLAYYHAHKEGNTLCKCGKQVKTYNIYRHNNSKIHQKYLASIAEVVKDIDPLGESDVVKVI